MTRASPSQSPSATAPPTPATIAGIPLPGGEVALAYSAALSANGGTAPYSWSIIAGALPGGLNLGQDGSVTGTPTAPGTFTFSIQVTDKNNASSSAGGSIKVYPRLVASLIPACASACSVEQGCVSVCGNFGTLSGGLGPYKYAASGNVPKGESLSGLSLAGSFPSLAQFWQFNVTVTDALGATASITPIFYVYKHITFNVSSASCKGSYVNACSVNIPFSGGTPGGKPTVHLTGDPTLGIPGGFSATVGTGFVTVTVQADCARTCPNGWMGIIQLTLSDQSTCGPAKCASSPSNIAIVMFGG